MKEWFVSLAVAAQATGQSSRRLSDIVVRLQKWSPGGGDRQTIYSLELDHMRPQNWLELVLTFIMITSLSITNQKFTRNHAISTFILHSPLVAFLRGVRIYLQSLKAPCWLKMILAHLVSSEGSSFTVLVDQGKHSSAANLLRIIVISNRILRPRIFDHFLIAYDAGFGQYSPSMQPLWRQQINHLLV